MSIWNDLNIAEKLHEILRDEVYPQRDHRFGRPFLTAYQIAIELNRRYPEICVALGHEVGGKGTGVHYSLAQYIGRELSMRMPDELSDIEGGFLSNNHLKNIVFDNDGQEIESSLTGTQYGVSVYRLQSV